jgi:predicted TIM-barrel fold metal-dependent hydrolase
MIAMAEEHDQVFGYCVVNPNFTDHALGEIRRCIAQGMIGVKLAASRRADDELLDPIATEAGNLGVPILHHVWQGRRREWPGQEASDASELATLARRFPETRFILAHLAGGGDWAHSIRAVRDDRNIWVDLSGSGVDPDMLHRAVSVLGADRLLWGSDLTMDTAWGKLRYLERMGLSVADLDAITFGNALRIFPEGCFEAPARSDSFAPNR